MRIEKVLKTVQTLQEKVQDTKSFTFLYQLFKPDLLLSLTTKFKLAYVVL